MNEIKAIQTEDVYYIFSEKFWELRKKYPEGEYFSFVAEKYCDGRRGSEFVEQTLNSEGQESDVVLPNKVFEKGDFEVADYCDAQYSVFS